MQAICRKSTAGFKKCDLAKKKELIINNHIKENIKHEALNCCLTQYPGVLFVVTRAIQQLRKTTLYESWSDEEESKVCLGAAQDFPDSPYLHVFVLI